MACDKIIQLIKVLESGKNYVEDPIYINVLKHPAMEQLEEINAKATKWDETQNCIEELEQCIEISMEDILESVRLENIGRDYEYLSQHEQVANLPTVENLQKLASRRREQEGAADNDKCMV